MLARSFLIAAALLLSAGAAVAQTHGQLLERAIFAEDTEGNQTVAIRIYEQLVSVATVPAEIAARARTRLASARREQAERAATLAAQRSGGQPVRIDPLAPPPPQVPGGRGGRRGGGPPNLAGPLDEFYDQSRPITVVGTVTDLQWGDPSAILFLLTAEGQAWGFVMRSPERMTEIDVTRESFKVGEQVRAAGISAKGVGTCPALLPNGCATFANGAQHAYMRQLSRADGTSIFPPGGGRGGGGGRGARSGGPGGAQ